MPALIGEVPWSSQQQYPNFTPEAYRRVFGTSPVLGGANSNRYYDSPVKMMMAGAMILALTSDAQAQPPMPSYYSVDSKYIKGDLDLRKHGISVVRTGTRTCGGLVEGETRVLSARVVTITQFDEEFPTCVLRLMFSHNYARVRITERRNCVWHGAGCDFNFNGLALRRRN